MDFNSKIEMLLAAAESVDQDESDGRNVSVARFEEVAAHSSTMPSHSLELSFSAVRASTPMKAVEDPSCSIPMDLSRSMLEDSPINLSIRDFDLEDEYRPLNLALAKAPPSVAAASLYSCCPLNLKKDSDEADDGNVPIPEAECGNNKPEFLSTSATIAALRTEQNFQVLAPSKMEGMKGEHTEIAARVSRLLTTPNDQSIYLTTSEILVEESQLVHQLEIKKSPMRSQFACPTYNPSEEDDGCTDPSQMTTVHSQPGPSTLQPIAGLSNFQACAGPSTSCPFAGPSTSQPFVGPSSSQEHTEDCDDDSDDDEDIEIGNVTLLNNFSIREYFEPYLNASVVGCCDVDSNKENLDSQGALSEGLPENRKRKSNEASDDMDISSSDDDYDDVALEELQNNKVLKNADPKLLNKFYKQRGMPYTRTNGTKAPPRSCRDPCYCVKLKCDTKYNIEMRKTMLRNFLLLSTSAQNQFLANHITISYTASSRVVNSKRVYAYKYYLPGNGGMVRVCKTMFMSTFDIKEKKARCLVRKKIKGLGIVSEDARKDNTRRQTISAEEKKFIERHIESFPAYTSHYARKKSSKMYLSADLNVSKMYDLYCIQCKDKLFSPVHYNTYRNIFRSYNIGFRKPKADTCGECDKLNVKVKQAKDNAELEILKRAQEAHQARTEKVYECKKRDVVSAKRNEGVCTVSFDLQKCLPTPHLTCGQAFYSRQLYTLNFTIFQTHRGHNEAHCYLWDESKARRGAQEIGSCVLHYVQNLVEKAHSDAVPIQQLNLYSDRCSGQNLNYVIVMTFIYLQEWLKAKNYQVVITHNLMVSGHSHMEVDSVHAAIERSKKNTHIDIETPRDWAVFISQIRRRVPFKVIERSLNDFVNLKMLENRYGRPKTNSVGEVLKLKEFMVFEYRPSALGTVFYKSNPADENYHQFHFAMQDSLLEAPLPHLSPINTEPLPLAQAKLEDLKNLLPYVTNKPYYETLLKNLVATKRGRRKKTDEEYHFDDDLDLHDD